ncbi:MAG: hypothetical protein R2864_03980 [Syntrophotaleaceae bacterium]
MPGVLNTVLIIGDSAETRKVVAGMVDSTGLFQKRNSTVPMVIVR